MVKKQKLKEKKLYIVIDKVSNAIFNGISGKVAIDKRKSVIINLDVAGGVVDCFDKTVYNAIVSLYKEGKTTCSYQQIDNAIQGKRHDFHGNNTAKSKRVNDIKTAVKKAVSVSFVLSLNKSDFRKNLQQKLKEQYAGKLVEGQLDIDTVKISALPLFEFSDTIKGVTCVNSGVYAVKNLPASILSDCIKTRLIERISGKWSNNLITLDDLIKHIPGREKDKFKLDRVLRIQVTKSAEKILQHFADVGYIHDFEKTRKNRKICFVYS